MPSGNPARKPWTCQDRGKFIQAPTRLRWTNLTEIMSIKLGWPFQTIFFFVATGQINLGKLIAHSHRAYVHIKLKWCASCRSGDRGQSNGLFTQTMKALVAPCRAIWLHRIALKSHRIALKSHRIALKSHRIALKSHRIALNGATRKLLFA
jgi:hypothetical protein